jgi:hypothetical protein
MVDKALSVQQSAVDAYIARVQRNRPDASPGEIVAALNKYFLSTVTTSGGAAGAASLAPGWGVPAALLDLAAFTEASVLYVLALADVHGLRVDDLERRRTLVLGILTGDSGSRLVGAVAPRTGAHWARAIITRTPMRTINSVNNVLGRNVVTKYGTKQGIIVLGKQLPLGLGAVIGASGNAGMGYLVVRSAKRAFGPPPVSWSAPHIFGDEHRVVNGREPDGAETATDRGAI